MISSGMGQCDKYTYIGDALTMYIDPSGSRALARKAPGDYTVWQVGLTTRS